MMVRIRFTPIYNSPNNFFCWPVSVKLQSQRDEMQEWVSEHGADAQADEGRHELFIEGLAETGDHDDADEGEKGDDGRGEETVAVDLR